MNNVLSNFIPPIYYRLARKLKIISQRLTINNFLGSMLPDNPLKGIKFKLVGDASADPSEFFTHYAAFGFWVAEKLKLINSAEILDLGSPKSTNSMLSSSYKITSLVLADCNDTISNVKYIIHDASNPLPFPDCTFDVFSSSVSLPLIGLARYGDKLDANSLHNLSKELDRVMKKNSSLLISMCLGPNILSYNNGWFLDLETMNKIFQKWELVDFLVDECSLPNNVQTVVDERFTKNTNISKISEGSYKVIFLHYKRQ